MFAGPLPDIPALFVHASVSRHGGIAISATGIGGDAAEARLRHDAERAERIALAQTGNPAQLAPDPPRRTLRGVAAGRDNMASVEHRALLELIERRACLSWWRGHRAAYDPGPQTRTAFEAAQLRWTRKTPRRTGLLQLGGAGLPPTCIAWSCDPSGRSLCFGTACRSDGPRAAIAALRELCQMEFGLSVIRHRSANGQKLAASEAALLDRAQNLSITALASRLRPVDQAADSFAGDLPSALASAGIAVSLTHLPRPVAGHSVVIATGRDPEAVSPGENRCQTAMRWNLYGA
ncbi:YcaO-like family protein [Microbulbifer sp. S227A]|uniref:YcaO-like family protein n=1 Tax=Microbulbifer sp. S227A TaxID=3415131 RepID=UPI003C79A95C